jgi:hypothetical protein
VRELSRMDAGRVLRTASRQGFREGSRAPQGCPYHRYFLVIWTGELHLTWDVLLEFLRGEEFRCARITDAFIGLDYAAVPLNVVPFPASKG